MNLRLICSILISRALRRASRWLHHGGTDLPGRVALRICPDLLDQLSSQVFIAAVTGTNGKTTSARMLEQAFQNQGLSCFSNRAGANLISGIATEFLMNVSLCGKMKYRYAVIESDEAAAKQVFPAIKPKLILVTNLFRDQLDRYGEVTHTLDNLRVAVAEVPDAVLCLNADCSLTASLSEHVPNSVVFYGVDQDAVPDRPVPEISDALHCIRCKTAYEYDYITYGHLGGYRCPKCGFRRADPQFAVTKLLTEDLSGSLAEMRLEGETDTVSINLPALYNVYNAAGAIAAACTMGVERSVAVESLSHFRCGFGRMEEFPLGRRGARMMLVKNPAGCNQVLEFLSGISEPFLIVLCLNDRAADGTDVSWIWDAEFELLDKMKDTLAVVTVSGDRASDMYLRVKYAGVPLERIRLERDYQKLVSDLEKSRVPVFLMPTYTAMLELRQAVVDSVGGTAFWE